MTNKPELVAGKWVTRRPWTGDMGANCFDCCFANLVPIEGLRDEKRVECQLKDSPSLIVDPYCGTDFFVLSLPDTETADEQ